MLLLLALACTSPADKDPDEAPGAQDSAVEERGPRPEVDPTTAPMPERLVGFADVHGDLQATLDVLQLAGLVDEAGHWSAGETVVVQTGDQLDRGDDEEAILELFERLRDEAWAAGGAFHPLLGNHETMQTELDFRYVTDGGWEDFADTPHDPDDPELADWAPEERGRVAAFRPGGEWAMVLATHNLVMQVGDTVFVHGGILPEHAEVGLERINSDVRAWMRDERRAPDRWLDGEGPVWTRAYSDDDEPTDCEALTQTLDTLGAARMVVGHTVQDQANPACDGRVWRMDVGMAAHYGGRPAALEITAAGPTLLEAR